MHNYISIWVINVKEATNIQRRSLLNDIQRRMWEKVWGDVDLVSAIRQLKHLPACGGNGHCFRYSHQTNMILILDILKVTEITRLSFSQIKSWVALHRVMMGWDPSCDTVLSSLDISTLFPLYVVLDHTNHTFSESLWHLLSTDHSPITCHPHRPTRPKNPPRTHLTWPFLHFMTFYTIQTKYFLKPHDTQYPLTHWLLTHRLHRPTKPTIRPSESRTVYFVLLKVDLSWRWKMWSWLFEGYLDYVGHAWVLFCGWGVSVRAQIAPFPPTMRHLATFSQFQARNYLIKLP